MTQNEVDLMSTRPRGHAARALWYAQRAESILSQRVVKFGMERAGVYATLALFYRDLPEGYGRATTDTSDRARDEGEREGAS